MSVFALKLFLAGFVVPVTIMFGILLLARQLRLGQEARSRRLREAQQPTPGPERVVRG